MLSNKNVSINYDILPLDDFIKGGVRNAKGKKEENGNIEQG